MLNTSIIGIVWFRIERGTSSTFSKTALGIYVGSAVTVGKKTSASSLKGILEEENFSPSTWITVTRSFNSIQNSKTGRTSKRHVMQRSRSIIINRNSYNKRTMYKRTSLYTKQTNTTAATITMFYRMSISTVSREMSTSLSRSSNSSLCWF